MRLLASFTVLAALALAGCKVRYDKEINCPSFEAKGVAIWKWDGDTYFIQTADGQHFLVSDVGCVVTPK